MKKTFVLQLFISFCLVWSCSNSDDNSVNEPIIDNTDPGSNNTEMYFPPINSEVWETEDPENLNWDTTALDPLLTFLENTDTRTFMILYKGRIVTENYFNGSDANSNLPWFSAGKTLSAFMVGIAQEEGFLELTDSSSDYLGEGWSSLTTEQESEINIFHHLTMTSGLDYMVNGFCTDAECLNYLNPAGSFWYYHNAPYTLIQPIVSGAINDSFDLYFKNKLRDPIGMQGAWVSSGFNRFYFSNARSMARFGLLCLNEGVWNDTVIMNDNSYFRDMVNTSQSLNEAYGYLWWLNGKDSYRVPGSVQQFNGKLIPNAPNDLIAGLGANDQKLYVVPSKDIVIIRQGGDGGSTLLGPSSYDNELWAFISNLIN